MRRKRKCYLLFVTVWVFLLVGQIETGRAADTDSAFQVDLPTAVARALQENPEVQAKRHTLGLATGRVQQAELLFQDNPRVSIEADYRNRRFRAPTGRSIADAEVSLLQEVEIAGQRGHRQQAATTHLRYTEWVIADAERLLQLAVIRAFYELLAAQERIQVQQHIMQTRDALFQAGRERFAQEDISVLEFDTLRLDTDQARTRLLTTQQEQVLAEKQLQFLLGTSAGKPLVAVGDLFKTSGQPALPEPLPSPQELTACALEQRPDYQAARLKVATQEAELRLARANRIPNISLGPMYKLDNEDQVVGAALTIPLPLFNRNAHEITAAMANVEIARRELQARTLAVQHEVAATYIRLQLAEQQRAVYGKNYLAKLTQSDDFTQQAYAAGELSIFEFSVALDRLTQARSRAVDAALTTLQTRVEFAAQLAFRCLTTDAQEEIRDAYDTNP
jgi:cobalt-zinc-cadmium efflux system outer membrane protein